MKRIIDTSEVLGTVDTVDGACELCAAANAGYDEASGRLVVELNSFLRTTNLRTKERRLHADWLPQPQTVSETVSPEEPVEVAREIFHRWARKVRENAPQLHHV